MSKRNLILFVLVLSMIAGFAPLLGVGDPVPGIGDENQKPGCALCAANGLPGQISVECMTVDPLQNGRTYCKVTDNVCRQWGDVCTRVVVRG